MKIEPLQINTKTISIDSREIALVINFPLHKHPTLAFQVSGAVANTGVTFDVLFMLEAPV